MLLYDVLYYTPNGIPKRECDSSIPRTAISFPKNHDIVRVACCNGERTVEWYRDGSQIPAPVWA